VDKEQGTISRLPYLFQAMKVVCSVTCILLSETIPTLHLLTGTPPCLDSVRIVALLTMIKSQDTIEL